MLLRSPCKNCKEWIENTKEGSENRKKYLNYECRDGCKTLKEIQAILHCSHDDCMSTNDNQFKVQHRILTD